jgi:carboxypeptidase C (cathepsin A)
MTCGALADLTRQLKHITDSIVQYSRGDISFEDPSYLDGESYAVLVVAKHASILVDVRNLNLPLVEMGYKITKELRGCA